MDYFSNLNFAMAEMVPHHTRTIVNTPRYYSIQFNYQGEFFLRVGDRSEHRTSGACAFLTYPGECFTYGSVNNQPRYHCFVCTWGKRIDDYVRHGLFVRNPENPLVHITKSGMFFRGMSELIGLQSSGGMNRDRSVLLFEDLLLQMHEASTNTLRNLSHHADFISELAEQITENPQAEYDFEAESGRCGVTSIHFRKLFREQTGLPPLQYLLQARLRKAAELLISSTLPVKAVAWHCGWGDVFYFSRLFKQKYHLSPTQYRAESGFGNLSAGKQHR